MDDDRSWALSSYQSNSYRWLTDTRRSCSPPISFSLLFPSYPLFHSFLICFTPFSIYYIYITFRTLYSQSFLSHQVSYTYYLTLLCYLFLTLQFSLSTISHVPVHFLCAPAIRLSLARREKYACMLPLHWQDGEFRKTASCCEYYWIKQIMFDRIMHRLLVATRVRTAVVLLPSTNQVACGAWCSTWRLNLNVLSFQTRHHCGQGVIFGHEKGLKRVYVFHPWKKKIQDVAENVTYFLLNHFFWHFGRKILILYTLYNFDNPFFFFLAWTT